MNDATSPALRCSVRPARPDDVPLVLGFLTKKARFDRQIGASDGVLAVDARSLSEALFGARPWAGCLLAEGQEEEGALGFAFHHFRFSSFAGRPSLWLDDLYVDETHRRRGVGAALLRAVAAVARRSGCTHLAWNADERNAEAMAFYREAGAALVPPRPHAVTWRLPPDALQPQGSESWGQASGQIISGCGRRTKPTRA